MDSEDQTRALLAPSPEFLVSVKVFPLIPYLKKDVIKSIDSSLSWEQLTASDINFAVVRPLVFKYARLRNMAVIYAALVVRSYFIAQSSSNLAHSGVMLSRAALCEILAMKLLAHFASNKIQLVAVLTTGWNPLAGAPPEIVGDVKEALRGDEDQFNHPQNAIEMAISTQAKAFLASPIVQSVVNDIYSGRIVFSITGSRAMLADNYKPRAIEIYDSRKAPFLDHYRLRVPKYNAILQFVNFAVLLLTFIACLYSRELESVTFWEVVFLVFAAAFTLKEYTATKEHGWTIYIANIWNVFDVSFVSVFVAYLGFRIKGLASHNTDTSQTAFDLLACGACILLPRLAFFAVSNNVVVLWTVKSIAWLMVQIWFGNTSLSFGQAASFHPFFGPILMTCFAALSNTLLLTILISILSNTVARIDAVSRSMQYLFQYAISTIEGGNSDALFSYQPPFNLIAFVILKPASWFLSPRALHSANVFLIRLTSFPYLVAIALYERHLAAGQPLRRSSKGVANSFYNSLPRHIKTMPVLEYLVGSHTTDLYDAIFEVEDSHDFGLFDGSQADGDEHTMHSLPSPVVPDFGHESSSGAPFQWQSGHTMSLQVEVPSPRTRKTSVLTPLAETSGNADVIKMDNSTPLARMFGRFMPQGATHSPERPPHHGAGLEIGIKRIEALLEDCKTLPVQRLRDEIQELHVRQARIENLLLTLTHGMHNDTNAPQKRGMRS
ncbi:hypothetical protein SERLADRAFT_356145 [Serpula lacrymans var. lacrymans S7.9]|uniref:Polycystin cation channel PKD1/PKD2 domain-containing protein n=1 Tax=Serpula lacrymans var. lacrymans (strain S7.9) TaxID=578457 RepID=F8NX84_SERL9|nr:uncharacterized protein SERLADRAFT_356145 [Serpula lacrymans var. lacrymans S7.9]EGO24559.1 hypothetical protein SERLADRAFT_356145 [Serpula lacrymans var. lacrymans S7.9]